MTENKNYNFKGIEVPEIKIAEKTKTIFDEQFNIPIYQRDFAWEKDEVNQLLKDISNFSGNNYYLGSLVVKKTKGMNDKIQYDVIDGQQRLTSLYILLSYLNKTLKKNLILKPLTYACRTESSKFLSSLNDNKDIEEFTFSDCTKGMSECYQTIKKYIKDEKINEEIFFNKLKNVVLFKIDVPENTDLNRYFITMNTTGEQLEQHEIMKARLIKFLASNENDTTLNAEQILFAKIWEACQDMDSYMQCHFDTPENRKMLFGDDENDKPQLRIDNFSDIANNIYNNNDTIKENTLDDIIIENYEVEEKNKNKDDALTDAEGLYTSILDNFQRFILHALNVFVEREKDNFNNYDTILQNKQAKLDNIFIIKNFEEALNNYKLSDKEFAKRFIVVMLNCRYLFDNFIIKRKYDQKSDSPDKRNWSLECNKRYVSQEDNKWSYKPKNTFDEKEKDKILMLQSCLRVSITAQNGMFWITDLLKFLYNKLKKDIPIENNSSEPFAKSFAEKIKKDFEIEIERIIIKNSDLQSFLKKDFNQGVATPHIVFNYLDYLLWKEINFDFNLIKRNNIPNLSKLKEDLEKFNIDLKDFKFEYRTTVEHWYPRHPKNKISWTTEENHETDVDMFGNLSILARDDNSDFSNLDPKAKKAQYKDKINNVSLKLRLMSIKTDDKEENLTKAWSIDDAKEHQKQMIALLKVACFSLKLRLKSIKIDLKKKTLLKLDQSTMLKNTKNK